MPKILGIHGISELFIWMLGEFDKLLNSLKIGNQSNLRSTLFVLLTRHFPLLRVSLIFAQVSGSRRGLAEPIPSV